MQFGICTTLSCAPSATVDLPIKSWKAIKEWFVKWDVLHYTLDGERWEEVELNSGTDDIIDWKRPIAVRVYSPKTFKTICEMEE